MTKFYIVLGLGFSMLRKDILLLFLLLIGMPIVAAHQPFIAPSDIGKEHPVEISQPEIARAFYGELRGEEHWFVLIAKEKFAFPFDILVPDKEDAEKVSAELLNANKQSLVLFDGENSLLKRYYHDALGGGYYLKGVGYGRNLPAAPVLPAGVYYLRVFNSNNEGKYSLVLGTHDDHPLKDIVANAYIGFYIKYWFFGKKSLLLDAAVVLLTLGVIIAILVQIVKRRNAQKVQLAEQKGRKGGR